MVSNVAVDGWAVGVVAMVGPTVSAVATDGHAMGAVSVGSSMASNIAVGGWAVGIVVAVSLAPHCCSTSKVLARI